MRELQQRWDMVFGIASGIAALMQGLILGGLLQGVQIEGQRFSGSVTGVVRILPLVTGVTLVVGYSLLGAGWLIFKSNDAIQQFAQSSLRKTSLGFVVLFCGDCIYATAIQSGIRSSWSSHMVSLSAITILLLLGGVAVMVSPARSISVLPLVLGLSVFALGMSGLALVVFPDIVPFRMSLWDAASSSASQRFLLIGATLVTPVILAYSAFAYWVFRERTPEKGWQQ